MKNLKIHGEEYSIPTSWNDVTLDQYARYASVSSMDGISKYDKFIKIIHVFTGIPVKTVKEGPVELFNLILSFMEFMKEPPSNKLKQNSITLNGVEYIIPKNLGNESFGEFVDADTMDKKHSDNPWMAVPFVMAIYLRPVGEKYDYKLVHERHKIFNQAPISEVYAVASFFLSNLSALSVLTRFYSTLEKAKQELRKERLLHHLTNKKHSGKDGDGMIQS